MALKKCLICSSRFEGRRDAKTCTPRCRKRLQQIRHNIIHDSHPSGAGVQYGSKLVGAVRQHA
ncbi:hypothetical protein HY380_00530 [Candidatus Saccharibacteria bacterium]|nr:hypothetical protein [Candidatus Saccharibacteria bacterium]